MRERFRGGVVRAAALRSHLAPLNSRSVLDVRRARRILVMRPDHLGDILLTTPALSALRSALPGATITALVGPWGAPALANNPTVDEVVTVRFPGFARDGSRSGLHAYSLLVATARRLRERRYDLAINLRPDFWWGSALLALAGVPRRIGFDLQPGCSALTDLLPAPKPDEHTVLSSMRAMRCAAQWAGAELPVPEDVSPESAPLLFTPTEGDRRSASSWLKQQGMVPGRHPLVLHPGSGALVKGWVPRKWAAVLAELAREYEAPIVVSGSSAERGQAEAVARSLSSDAHVAVLAGDQPIGMLAALFEQARLVLGVDSGPLHLATAVGTPTVRLYGPTSVACFGPWGPSNAHVALASDLACAPCGRLDYRPDELAAHPCVRVIAPAAVISAAHSVLRVPCETRAIPEQPSPEQRASVAAP